jgi:hypothetical protein
LLSASVDLCAQRVDGGLDLGGILWAMGMYWPRNSIAPSAMEASISR